MDGARSKSSSKALEDLRQELRQALKRCDRVALLCLEIEGLGFDVCLEGAVVVPDIVLELGDIRYCLVERDPAAETAPGERDVLDDATIIHDDLAAHVLTVPGEGWMPLEDLRLAENMLSGLGLPGAAEALDLPTESCADRWRQLCGTFDPRSTQTRRAMVDVLRAKVSLRTGGAR